METTEQKNENPHGVKPGQVWQDNDERKRDAAGSLATLTIDRLERDGKGRLRAVALRSGYGEPTKVLVTRFHGGRSGFTKISDAR